MNEAFKNWGCFLYLLRLYLSRCIAFLAAPLAHVSLMIVIACLVAVWKGSGAGLDANGGTGLGIRSGSCFDAHSGSRLNADGS